MTSTESATRAIELVGSMATFTGGPTTEFFRAKLATILGASGFARSRITTESLPGADRIVSPFLSHRTFSSLPTIAKGWACRELAPARTRNVAPPIDENSECLVLMMAFLLLDRSWL